jgi:MFS family permease
MNYFSFIGAHYRFLLFGFLMMGLSNFGQTFFIALYSNEIRIMFDLSNAGFGGLYSAATLASALAMVINGRSIDDWPLRRYTLFVLGGLTLGCVAMGLAAHVAVLFLALFMLRHFGQGLSSHTAMTSAGRAFDKNRGQAVSLVQLGYAGFESFFPIMAVTAIALIGWQQTWFLYAALLLVVAIPLQMVLVGYEPRCAILTDEDGSEPGADRATMLRDKRFYMVLPLYLAPPCFLTGLFFHQVQMAAARGWAIETLAAAFTLYAFIKVASSLATGPLVDRFTALRLLPFSVVPLVAAFWLLTLTDNLFGAATPFIYMGLIGLNLGMVGPISGGLWPELFGTAHLGAIRSLTAPIVIAATAVAPVLFGLAVDMNISFSAIGLSGIIFLIGSALLAFSLPADKLATK